MFKKCKISLRFAKTISRSTKWWILASSLIESVTSRVGFDFGLQMLLPSCKGIIDKSNLIICFCFHFVVLFYACSFYPILYSTKKEKNAKVVILPLRRHTFSYFHQPYLIFLKILARSFIHAFFLSHYPLQVGLLFASDIVYIIFCFRIKCFFYSGLLFMLQFIYLFAFTALDFYYFVESSVKIVNFQNIREIYGLVTVCTIIGVSILMTLALFVIWIRKKIKMFRKSKIQT